MIPRHRPRPVRFLRLWAQDQWRLKLYGISECAERPDSASVDAALAVAAGALPRPALAPHRHGLGFVTVHQALAFNQVIVDWWEHGNELRHRVFRAEPETPCDFAEITATGEAFCVWELAVIGFEREAWLAHVLTLADGPDFEAYLSRVLDTVC